MYHQPAKPPKVCCGRLRMESLSQRSGARPGEQGLILDQTWRQFPQAFQDDNLFCWLLQYGGIHMEVEFCCNEVERFFLG